MIIISELHFLNEDSRYNKLSVVLLDVIWWPIYIDDYDIFSFTIVS